LLDQLEAEIVSVSFLIELAFLNGREKLGEHNITSIISY
jgi:adenine/guanine phosphoribosyltransferase-like PRPP-binding protein